MPHSQTHSQDHSPEAGSCPLFSPNCRGLLQVHPSGPFERPFFKTRSPLSKPLWAFGQLLTASARHSLTGPTLVSVPAHVRSHCPTPLARKPPERRAPYQVFHHGFDLLLGHIYVLRGAFQGDLVLALGELDVNLPQQRRKGQSGQSGRDLRAPTGAFQGGGRSPGASHRCTSTDTVKSWKWGLGDHPYFDTTYRGLNISAKMGTAKPFTLHWRPKPPPRSTSIPPVSLYLSHAYMPTPIWLHKE